MYSCGNADWGSHYGNSIAAPQNLKNATHLLPSNSMSGYTSEETQDTNSKEYMYPCVHYSVIYNSQAMEATQMTINSQVDKKACRVYTHTHTHTHNGLLLGHKKKKKPYHSRQHKWI